MRSNFKRMIEQPNYGVARWISILFVTSIIAFFVTLLVLGQIIPNIPLHFSLPSIFGQSTVTTNGADQWNNDERVTAPVTNFSPLSSDMLSVSALFTRAYQTYGASNNTLGVPITAAFPSTSGWLQFFTNGALLLPSTQQAQIQNNDASLAALAHNGTYDAKTSVIRLPLIQTLLSVGSILPVGGPGSTLTYVDLRKATSPDLMRLIPTNDQVTRTNLSSTPIVISPQGVFIQGGTREGKAIGHLIPTAIWNYINQSAVSPHSWEMDFGMPLTEALAFTLPVNGQTHHMLIQVFLQEALMLDEDAGQVQGISAGTGNSTDTTEQSAIQLLPTSADYLSTVGMPDVTIQAQQSVWAQGDTALLDTAGTGQQIAHVGQNFPLTLLGDTSWIGGVPWYHTQWSVLKNKQKGWISGTALTFNSPRNAPSTASFDVLSANLSSYLANLGPNAGAVVYDLTRQQTYTYNGSSPFISASSIKVPIMLTFLDAMEQQGREPTNDEMNLLTTMIENSDNDSASTLFDEVGDSAGINAYMQKIGINGLTPNDDAWGYSTITPQTMVNLLTLLYNGKILNHTHRALALNLMENVESDQQTGVGDTAPNNATVALKDGWVTGDDNLWAMNSSGIVIVGKETYVISVYTQEQEELGTGQDITREVCSTVASLLDS